MNELVRPWFYTACLVVWLCVGLGPSVYYHAEEQDVIDERFYANVVVPPPAELFQRGIQISKQISEAASWDDYGRALRAKEEFAMHLRKYTRKIWRYDEDVDYIQQSQTRMESHRRVLTEKMDELRERDRRKDASIGSFPKNGFDISFMRPEAAPFWKHFWLATWTSWPIAFLVLLVRIDACGYRIALELPTPWLYLATFLWPIGLFKYPTGDPARQLIRGLRFAAFALTAGLGMSPAMAYAQTKDGKDNRKKSSPYAFSIDARNVSVVGPDPKPEFVTKSMLTTPKGWVWVGSFSKSESTWATTQLVGRTAYKRNGIRLDATAGLTKNSAGATVVPVGVVGSVNKPRWQMLIPFAGYERRFDKPSNHLVSVNQVLLKSGAWRAGIETFFKKATGSSLSWYAGPILARTVGKKGYAEVVGYRDHAGDWRVRSRFAFAHSW